LFFLLFLALFTVAHFSLQITGVDWRQKLDAQSGAVLANEIKNNNSKLARWTSQAILAGVDTLKLGYVSRILPRDPSKHVILGVRSYKPSEFSSQINLNIDNAWYWV